MIAAGDRGLSTGGRWAYRRLALVVLGALVSGCVTGGATPSSAVSPSPSANPSVAPTASPSYGPTPSPPACVSQGSIECVQAGLAEQAELGKFAGVVLVAEHWELVWQGAYGTVGSSEVPYRVNTEFGIHSVGKMFTAVAIAQLEESGGLSFEDSIDTYVPGLQVDVGHATIAQLLSHTSGIGDSFVSTGLEHQPGTFNYANRNFELLGLAVEGVTGQAFQAYIDENVFAPAGMDATRPISERPLGFPAAADGQKSTVTDLLRFADALFAYRLLSEETTTLVTSPQAGTDEGYGYGFAIFGPGEPPEPIGHFGTDGRAFAVLLMYPSQESAMVIFAERGFSAIESVLAEYPSYLPD